MVLRLDILKGNDSGGFLVDDGAEAGLALDDNVGDTHLAAESRKVDHEFDGVNVVSDHDEGGLLGLNESNDMVEAVLDKERLLGVVRLLVLAGIGGGSGETSLLLLLRLGAVLVEEFEQLGRGVLVKGVGELGDGGGNLETLVEDDLLALKANVFGPFHEASEIASGLDVLT